MKQRYKLILIIVAVMMLAVGGVWYGKHLLWKAQPADAIPIAQKERSPIDLRPAVIAKLQGLVKNGSDSLYKLRIDSLFTEVSSGTIMLRGIGLYPDSSEIKRLDKLQQLPDDVFEIRLSALRITGIGLADILNRRDMHIGAIVFSGPQIAVHHQLRPYNAAKRAAAKQQSFYSRIRSQVDRLQIDSIAFAEGVVSDYHDDITNTFREVSMLLRNILIDSAAEKDPTRFLFAKAMHLKAGSINIPVQKSQYDLGIGEIDVTSEKREVAMRNFSLHPRGGKEAFAKGLRTQKSVFTVDAPSLVLRNVNWWALMHGESLIADEAEATNVYANAYIDRHRPLSPVTRANFPQQLLTDLKTAVSIKRFLIKNASLEYEEYNDKSNKVSIIAFRALNMEGRGVTNVPSEIAAQPIAHVHATSSFLGTTPLTADFGLALSPASRGAFKVDVVIGAMGHDVLNPFSEDMGLVRFTSGEMQGGTAHLEGNNDEVHGKVSIRYTDLHLEPLKKQEDEHGRLKAKHVSKKLANLLFVKNNNPGRGSGLREPEVSLARTKESNFFSLVWAGAKLGLLKTIGVPPKMAGM